jgi:hypothetical protein
MEWVIALSHRRLFDFSITTGCGGKVLRSI